MNSCEKPMNRTRHVSMVTPVNISRFFPSQLNAEIDQIASKVFVAVTLYLNEYSYFYILTLFHDYALQTILFLDSISGKLLRGQLKMTMYYNRNLNTFKDI